MTSYVKVYLDDAELILLVVTPDDKFDEELHARFRLLSTPILLIVNKIDVIKGTQVDEKVAYWKEKIPNVKDVLAVSAVKGTHTDTVMPKLLQFMPEHPPYFPEDEYTDRTERFFASEIIREKIFLTYEEEVPYSTEVKIESFKEAEDIIRISATIYVERDSQKGIIIGKAGSAIKKVGTDARKDMETFFRKKVFLETHVKVADNWRKQSARLRQFGYTE